MSVEVALNGWQVVIEEDEEGVFVAECPALPGCISDGVTLAEAEVNIQTAIEECLMARRELGLPIPRVTKSVEVAA